MGLTRAVSGGFVSEDLSQAQFRAHLEGGEDVKPEREEEVRCENCFYFENNRCCRRPPLALGDGVTSRVTKSDWCGDGLFWIEQQGYFVPPEHFIRVHNSSA